MSDEKTIATDLLVPPSTRFSMPAHMDGMKDFLGAPTIALTTYLAAWYLGLDWNFGSGVLTATCLITGAQIATSGLTKGGSIIKIVMQGLFMQFVCHHFGMGDITRIWNAFMTCSALYAITNRSSSTAERPFAESPLENDKQNADPSLVIDSPNIQDSKLSGVWIAIAYLIPMLIVAKDVFARQPSTNTCIAFTKQEDSTHWHALIYDRDLSGTGCDATAQMALAEREMNVYTRNLEDEVCSVSCLKQNYSGYWTAYVSVTPSGSPADGKYCGEAYSYGDCGTGLVRRRVGSL
jgi:hypothetical protein